MLSDAPPSCDDVTTSATCRDSIEVKTFTNSGITAPASVPHEIIRESFHHKVGFPPRSGIVSLETMNVAMIETIDVIQTREVRGASKFIWSLLPYRPLAMPSLMK